MPTVSGSRPVSTDPSAQSAELAGEAELFHMPAAPGLASPDSGLSDGSAQAGMPAEAQDELVMVHSRGARQQAPSPDHDSQQGARLPGSAKPEQQLRASSKGQAKRMRDDADDDSPEKAAKQRRPSRAGPHDRRAAHNTCSHMTLCLAATTSGILKALCFILDHYSRLGHL